MKSSKALLVSGAFILCGCSIPIPFMGGYPLDSVFDSNMTLFERQRFGLKVGHRYRLRQAHVFYWDCKEVGRFPTGTTVVINSVYRWNTVTQGYKYHLRATVRGGDNNGTKIRIHEKDAPLFEELPMTDH